MSVRETDAWGWKECIALLFVEFGVAVVGIKFFLQPMYEKWFNHELYAGTLMGATIAITLLVGTYVIALRPHGYSWKEVGVQKFQTKDWKLIGIYTAVLIVGSVVIMLLTMLVGNSLENNKTDSMRESISLLTVIIAFISAAVISPIYEEIFYRGFFYRFFRARLGVTYGIVISSLIFTIAHIPTYNAMPVNFFGGIIFALAYERTHSIWAPILIHGLTNAVFVLLTITG